MCTIQRWLRNNTYLYIYERLVSQVFDFVSHVTVHPRPRSIDHWDGDGRVNLCYPLYHWILCPAEWCHHVLKCRFTTEMHVHRKCLYLILLKACKLYFYLLSTTFSTKFWEKEEYKREYFKKNFTKLNHH